jgi:indolepyruvate decarboxylase
MPALPEKPELACMNLIESLLHALKDHGARQIFGIPGDFALPYFRIIEESKILPLYTLSHEPGVGFAADASARINGSLGVAAVTYGAGALNMINSIAAAFAEKSPLVVLSGGPGKGESRSGLLLHHQAKTLDSQFQIFKEITCDQVRLDDAARAPADIARVLASCLRRSEPVYIEIPRDMVNEPCAPVVPEAPQAVDPDALAACVDEILARLASARSPVLMAGVEVRRYGLEAQVAQLARRLGVPVVTSFMGRGLLADQDVPLLGTYMGVAGLSRGDAAGGKLGRPVPARRDHLRHQLRRVADQDRHAQDDPGAGWPRHHRLPHLFQLPLAAVVERMLACVSTGDKPLAVTPPAFPHGLVADDASITPTDIATAVNDLMAAHGKPADRQRHGRLPVHRDGDPAHRAGGARLLRHHGLRRAGRAGPAGRHRRAPADPGGRRRLPDDRLGAGQLPRYGWDPIVLVFNNASWEMLRTFQPESGFNDLGHWGFAEMAAGMGGDGVRVNTRAELKAALDRALATRGRFQLIDITIPSGVLSQTLARFVAGVKRLNAPK